ncbi:cytochrome P450 [Phenylobacterium montanum]|uniref:Cytochrome P450 n=1 Tax=Phenylobacterium montanum TaxID=2823693 RepID=A0A975IX87_9CAUL|nr:cytochrome P450 [Caulobacter sp. S6]QUD89146.1 cytochrome P450 [Caulobacter sp. S6]
MNVAVKPEAASDAEAYVLPLAELNPARTDRFQADTIWPVFERLRREDPVHFTADSEFGPYWSITRWDDIMAVDTDHEGFSSAEGIGLFNLKLAEEQDKALRAMGQEPRKRGSAGFITMDEPEHSVHRKAVSPTVAPANLATMAPIVRERAGAILDSLPIGTPFDWVDLVSKELTAMTLATLFDFPFEQRRKLPWWSDMFMNQPGHGPVESWQQKAEAVMECFGAFEGLWNQRVQGGTPGNDLISMLVHHPETREMSREQYHGTVVLLIVGGNDTTRNTISGSVHWLNKNPGEYDKLRANPALVGSMVSETIRYQTPLAHMTRVATRDIEVGGKTIKKGDRVVMWYISGNRDEAVIEEPDAYVIDRERPRHHMSFGFGVHRCVGNRVAEMQLTIIWEEILKRFPRIELVGEPVRTYSSFVHGYESMQVVIPARA